MTSYQIPTNTNLKPNEFIRAMLAANGGNYPKFVKANKGGAILKKSYDASGAPEYWGVNQTGHWMTANRVASLIASGAMTALNATPLEA